MDMKAFNEKVIAEFRENDGVVGGPFEGMTMLLLSTRGAKSGKTRVSPLVCLPDPRPDGDRWIIAASNGGAPRNPPWFANVVADPNVHVEVGAERFDATATPTEEPERSELYARLESVIPAFAGYREKAGRVIPVVVLTRATD